MKFNKDEEYPLSTLAQFVVGRDGLSCITSSGLAGWHRQGIAGKKLEVRVEPNGAGKPHVYSTWNKLATFLAEVGQSARLIDPKEEHATIRSAREAHLEAMWSAGLLPRPSYHRAVDEVTLLDGLGDEHGEGCYRCGCRFVTITNDWETVPDVPARDPGPWWCRCQNVNCAAYSDVAAGTTPEAALRLYEERHAKRRRPLALKLVDSDHGAEAVHPPAEETA